MFDGILADMAAMLSTKNVELHDFLMNGRTDRDVGYCDLSELDNDKFILLVQVAASLYVKVISSSPSYLAKPKFYPSYVKQFENLLDMMKTDPQAEKLAS